jgi:hypothetical protein
MLDSRGRHITREYVNKKRTKSEILKRDSLGRKYCIYGKHWVPLDWFSSSSNKNSADGLHSYCRRCITIVKHKITPEYYKELLEKQKYRCAICKCPLKFNSSSLRRKPALDHNHECCGGPKGCEKCIRGILCFDCNNLIAFALESISTLENAITYLKEWK